MLLLLLTPLLVLSGYIIWFYVAYVRRYPVGPRPLPIVGNLLQIPADNMHLYMAKMKDKYGVFTIFLPGPTIVFASYANMQETLVEKGDHFAAKQETPIFRLAQTMPNGGILFGNHEMWREQRREAMSAMRRIGRPRMNEMIMASVAEMCEELRLHELRGTADNLDISPFLQFCVANVISHILFGYLFHHSQMPRLNGFVESLCGFLVDLFSPGTSFYQAWPVMVHVPYFNRAYKRMQHVYQHEYMGFIREEVDVVCQGFHPQAVRNNFMDHYLAAAHQQNNLNMGQLYNVVSDFWMAGMETTATTLRWAVLYLMKYPEYQAKVYEEVKCTVKLDREVTIADKARMPQVTAFLNEVQRLPGVVGMNFREVGPEAQIVAGHLIPARTHCLYLLPEMMYDEEYFGEAPLEFRPERWLSPDGILRPEMLRHFAPFSIGRRRCPGELLATDELFLIFVSLVQRYEFNPVAGAEVDLTPNYGVVLYPKRQNCSLRSRK